LSNLDAIHVVTYGNVAIQTRTVDKAKQPKWSALSTVNGQSTRILVGAQAGSKVRVCIARFPTPKCCHTGNCQKDNVNCQCQMDYARYICADWREAQYCT